jgi:hypothetical protein
MGVVKTPRSFAKGILGTNLSGIDSENAKMGFDFSSAESGKEDLRHRSV